MTTTFTTLSILGIIVSGYLVYKRLTKSHVACPIRGNCQNVLDSKWATIFGIRNEYLGILYYISLLIGILALTYLPQYFTIIFLFLLIADACGFIYSLFLTELQFFIIKSYCFFCLISALISTLLFFTLIFIK